MTHQTDVDVLIVGAGPTGLTLACLLARYGVKFKIIEKNKMITDRSKALGVQARSLELLEQLGITEKALVLGHPAKGLDLVVRGQHRMTLDLEKMGQGLTKYPYLLILEQCKTEQLLLEKLQSLSKDVEWQKELVDLKQHADHVSVDLIHAGRLESLRAKYVVAADGARSSVRSFLQLPFDGGTYENRFLLADIAVQGKISREHVTLCLSKEGFAGFFPMIGTDRFRAIGEMPDWAPENADKEFGFMAQEIVRHADLPLSISDPQWISTYKIHHRNILHFKVQRCFFAGDAAHIHSPAGAQGMNTGIQDAFNLAWKLHCVLEGKATDRLLETYHDERFPVARNLVHTTDRVFSFVTDQRAWVRMIRLYMIPTLIRGLSRVRWLREFVFKRISQIGICYDKSSLSEQSFLADSSLKAGDRFCMTLGDGLFHAFIVGEPEMQKSIICVLQKYFEGRIRIHTLDKRPEISNVMQSYGLTKDGLILVRPDEYVAYCSERLETKPLIKYLQRYFLSKDLHRQKETEDRSHYAFENFI